MDYLAESVDTLDFTLNLFTPDLPFDAKPRITPLKER
jgi:hypothetical protein